MNFVKTASAAGEFEWAEKFIEDYKSTIPAEERENVLNFCYGAIEHKKGNLEKALKYFSKSNFSNYILKVQVKILLCRVYYELEMYEQTLSMIDTFKHYLVREKMFVDEQKEAYLGFLKILTQLITYANFCSQACFSPFKIAEVMRSYLVCSPKISKKIGCTQSKAQFITPAFPTLRL